MSTDSVFLSVRVPADLRGRLKVVAAKRGISIQQLMSAAIEDLLTREEAEAPKLANVMAELRAHAPELRRRGVDHVYVFGSVARGEARVDSDVDLAVDVAPNNRFSLVTQASIAQDVEQWLGRGVDLGERRALRPSLLAEFERDAVRVF